MASATKVKVGMKFVSGYADSNSLWIVRRSLGKAWECEIITDGDENLCDWIGTKKAFLAREILGSIAMQDMFAGIQDESERFLQSQIEGAILHYHNGFGQYVRQQVVIEGGRRKLKAIALVGNWYKYDLPSRDNRGVIRLGYHAEKIENGVLSDHLQCSTTYEHPKFVKPGTHRGADKILPRSTPPICLDLPDMTPAELESARLWRLIDEVQESLSEGSDDPKERLKAAYKKLMVESAKKSF